MASTSRGRKPLSDQTNSIASANYPSTSKSVIPKPSKPNPSVVFNDLLNDVSKKDTDHRRNDSANRRLNTSSSNPSASCSSRTPAPASTPSTPLKSVADSGAAGKHEWFEPSTVYHRRSKSVDTVRKESKEVSEPSTAYHQRKSVDTIRKESKVSEPSTAYHQRKPVHTSRKEGKVVSEPMSSSLAEKRQYKRDKINEVENTRLTRSCAVQHRKKKQCKIDNEKGTSKNGLSKDFIEQQKAYFAEIDKFELEVEEVEDLE